MRALHNIILERGIATRSASRPATPSRPPRQWRPLALTLCLGVMAGSALAACAVTPGASETPTASNTTQTAAIHIVFEAKNTTQSSNGLRETVVALDVHSGKALWRHALETPNADDGNYAADPAVIQDGLVYVGYRYTPQANPVAHAVLEALDAATGQTRWRQELDAGQVSEISGSPVVDGSSVYVTTGVYSVDGQQGLVTAFDAQSGKVRWSKALPDSPKMPAIANGDVLFLTQQAQGFGARLVALHASDGSTAWTYTSTVPLTRGGDVDNAYTTAPLIGGDLVFAQALDRNPDGTADMVQLAIAARDGSLAWQYDTGGNAATPAISEDGATLCVGVTTFTQSTGASSVVALAAATGQKRWGADLPRFSSGCVASGNTFLVNTGSLAGTNGSPLALSSQDGHHLWEITTDPPVDADGVLAPTVSDGIVVDLVVPLNNLAPLKTTFVVARVSDGTVLWRHTFAARADKAADIEGDQIYIVEQQWSTLVVSAYSLSTGTRLWSYTLQNG